MIETGLQNKVVIVTGANHGIGAATALAFARQGAKIFVHYLRQSPELYGETRENVERAKHPGRAYYCKMIGQSAERVVAEIDKLGVSCFMWESDLSDPDCWSPGPSRQRSGYTLRDGESKEALFPSVCFP